MRVARGYHGTTLSVARAIVQREAAFEPSPGDVDDGHWLGRGIYFWEENPIRAIQWAHGKVFMAAQRGIIEEPAVVVADINLDDCLDLAQPQWNEAISRVGETIADLPRQHGPVFQSRRGKRLPICDYDMPPEQECVNSADSRVIDALLAQASSVRGRPYNTKRGAFQVGRQLFSNSYLFEEGHVQIAVLDASVLTLAVDLMIPPPMGASPGA